MHLSRLELYGFKSFADDVRIELPPGLTVLVGPNGGGKSNVVDAIRWALGEQRLKDLRADRWEDLLYSGGERRPPAQMAEVFLEFDNRDGRVQEWPEVLRVGRRLFRNGDSEYLIGNRTVRLKDVTDLFLDSGLSRTGYAIIGQGKVEAALLMRPAERLEQLEEASGTTRYKVRRRETMQHLDAAMAELNRVADLVAEVDRQRLAVEAEAVREREYLERERQRQELKRGILAARREEVAARVGVLRAELAAWERVRTGLQGEWEGVTEAVRAMEATLPEDAAALDDLLAQSLGLERERERWRGRVESLERDARELSAQLAEVEREMAEPAPTPFTAEGTDDDPRPAMRDALARARALAAERAVHVAATGEAREAAQRRWAELDEARRQAEQWEQQVRALTGRPDLALDAACDEVRRDAERSQQRVIALDADIRLAREQGERLRRYLSQEEERREVIRHQLAQRQARLRVLQQLEAEGEGLGQGVRAVLRAGAEGQLQGILGTLGSLIETDERYGIALQAALGGAAQDVVTETEQAARQAVRYLQSRGLGRATFLPLDTVRGQVPARGDQDLERQAGAVGWAMQLIRLPERLQIAARHVLGRVLVVEQLEDAVRIGRLVDFRYRVVTLDGQLVQPGGAITGGSPALQNSAWVRRQELERLTSHIERERQQLEGLDSLLNSARGELEETRLRLDALHQERMEAQQQLAEAAYRLKQMERLLPASRPHPAELTRALEEATRQAEAADQAWRAAQTAAREADHEVTRQEATLARVEQDWAEREALRQARLMAAEQAKNRRAALEERGRRLRAAQADNRAALAEAVAAVEQVSATLADVNEQVGLLRQARADAEEDLRMLRERARALELELKRGEHRAENLAAELAEREREWAELQADPDAMGAPAPDVREARRRLTGLEAELAAMGPVSGGSLAMYEALAARAAFLERERQDVERAVAELTATLKELDAEVTARRNQTARVVERAFQETTSELFGGGRAGFRYLEEPEPGLDLWVEPPGKRPQSLTSLSGGEKALGALAWLFALLAVRPAPLVVLDEVEASLDELNARRFAQYLARRRQSQYVVVSHHKPTMEHADALWGFTSDARGVTRLVSVRLQASDEVI
jgi:chromosome segregation protein